MEFSIQEKIELILNLYIAPRRYLAESIDEFPEGKRFVDAGYTYLDVENNVYYVNQAGDNYLHIVIKQISEDLIAFIKKNGCLIPKENILDWFTETLEITDDVTRDLIFKYIIGNLTTYEYRIYFSNRRNKYVLEKI